MADRRQPRATRPRRLDPDRGSATSPSRSPTNASNPPAQRPQPPLPPPRLGPRGLIAVGVRVSRVKPAPLACGRAQPDRPDYHVGNGRGATDLPIPTPPQDKSAVICEAGHTCSEFGKLLAGRLPLFCKPLGSVELIHHSNNRLFGMR